MTQQSQQKNSERKTRIITGIFLAATLLVLWWLQGWPLRIALWGMLLAGIWEMYAAFEHKGARPVKWVGLGYGLCVVPAYLYFGGEALGLMLALFVMMGFGIIVLGGKVDLESAVATVLPMIYPGFLTSLLIPIVDIQPQVNAMAAMGLAFILSLLNDVAAYLVGMRIGKHKLSPDLSPKKSIEGAVAGALASMLGGLLVPALVCLVTRQPISAMPPLWHFALLGLVGGVVSPFGDLTASLIKRYCGIKDYGRIFPGHGGMVDRMDSVIFVGAVVYCYFALVLGVV